MKCHQGFDCSYNTWIYHQSNRIESNRIEQEIEFTTYLTNLKNSLRVNINARIKTFCRRFKEIQVDIFSSYKN